MNKTIRTYSDLCEERERVKNLLVVQKQRMRDDWDGLKNEFLPVKKVFGVMGKMTSPNKNTNPLMSKGLKVAFDVFITKFVLSKAGWVTKLAVPFVLSNYSTHMIADKGQNFIAKVASFLNSKKKVALKEKMHSDGNGLHQQTGTVEHTFTGNDIERNVRPGGSGTYMAGEA